MEINGIDPVTEADVGMVVLNLGGSRSGPEGDGMGDPEALVIGQRGDQSSEFSASR